MSSRIALDSVRLELARISAEVAQLSTRVQDLSRLLDQWADQEGLIDESVWEEIEAGGPPFANEGPFHLPPTQGEPSATDPVPPVPPDILELCRTRLRASTVPLEPRVRRAFEAGHRARVALASGSGYRTSGPVVHLHSTHWIVLRGPWLESPVRVASKRQATQAAGGTSQDSIIEEFPSLTELQVFCLGASIEVPPLKECRKVN